MESRQQKYHIKPTKQRKPRIYTVFRKKQPKHQKWLSFLNTVYISEIQKCVFWVRLLHTWLELLEKFTRSIDVFWQQSAAQMRDRVRHAVDKATSVSYGHPQSSPAMITLVSYGPPQSSPAMITLVSYGRPQSSPAMITLNKTVFRVTVYFCPVL